MYFNGLPLLAYPSDDNPLDATPFDQIGVADENGEYHHICVYPTMTVERLKKAIDAIGR